MRKFLAILFAALLLCGSCLAEGLDYASMTDDQLHAIVDAARNELAKRELVAEGDTLLFEKDGVSVYLTSDFEANSYGRMRAKVVIINDSDKNMGVGIDSLCVNGWELTTLGFSTVSAGKKSKDELYFDGEDAEITSVEEIETIEITFHTYDGDTYQTISKIDPVTLHFNVQ